jgi:hypothetical protein
MMVECVLKEEGNEGLFYGKVNGLNTLRVKDGIF